MIVTNGVNKTRNCSPSTMPHLPSLVWDYFEKVPDSNIAKCLYCGDKISRKAGNTSVARLGLCISRRQ